MKIKLYGVLWKIFIIIAIALHYRTFIKYWNVKKYIIFFKHFPDAVLPPLIFYILTILFAYLHYKNTKGDT